MRRLIGGMIAVLVLFAPGCSGQRGGPLGPPVDFKPLSVASLREKLAEWKGNVVVVDFWAFF